MAVSKQAKDETSEQPAAKADTATADKTETADATATVGPAEPFNDGVGQVDEQVNPAQGEMQETVDEAEDKGFYGVEVDQTDNKAYTVEGVVSGMPTPETVAKTEAPKGVVSK